MRASRQGIVGKVNSTKQNYYVIFWHVKIFKKYISFIERGKKIILKEKMDPSFGIFGNITLLKMEFSELNNYLPET
jgi:hypothetical protein